MKKHLNIRFLRWLPLLALLVILLTPGAALAQRTDPDLDQDGFPDLIWQDNRTGDATVWYMNGAQWTGYWDYLAKGIPTEWKIVGVVDLFGDGSSDLVWQNNRTGDVTVWYMNGATWTGNWDYLAKGMSTDWKIAGTADLDSDGKSDLIWQNSKTGDSVVWYMDGASWTGSWDYLAKGISTDWKITGTADLDGDGLSDLVWQNSRTGDSVVWYMDGASWTGYWDYLARGVPVEWKIVRPH